jgi:hypothetical protein
VRRGTFAHFLALIVFSFQFLLDFPPSLLTATHFDDNPLNKTTRHHNYTCSNDVGASDAVQVWKDACVSTA